MSHVHLGVLPRFFPDLTKLDRRTRHEVNDANNKIQKIGIITRTGIEEITNNAIAASHQGAQVLATAEYMATIAPNNDALQGYLRALDDSCLQRMRSITNLGNDAIIHFTGKLCG